MLHRLAVAALALILTAETPPPAALAPYVEGGRLDPGDYGWMRGAFADATPADKAAWRDLEAWRSQCRTEQSNAIRAALAQRAMAAVQGDASPGTGLCGDVAYARPHADGRESWPAFQAAVARARPVARAIVWSAALAQATADPDSPDDLRALLIARPTTDQVLRRAVSWDKGETPGAPPLDPAARRVADGMIWLAIAARDHANTAWLKALVAKQGWPTIATVGADASHMAWLLVQHADDDPVFQLDMLRLMEPLAAKGDVAKKDYAFLYDRVMLKLSGRQRYGSQMTCAGGRSVPLQLEDAAGVDRLRAGMGMGTVAENAARIVKLYGPCPADVSPAPAKR